MDNSGQSLEDQNACRNAVDKGQTQEVSVRNEECVDCWTPYHTRYALAENVPAFCVKPRRPINLVEENLKESI